jgi:hypothetical protein
VSASRAEIAQRQRDPEARVRHSRRRGAGHSDLLRIGAAADESPIKAGDDPLGGVEVAVAIEVDPGVERGEAEGRIALAGHRDVDGLAWRQAHWKRDPVLVVGARQVVTVGAHRGDAVGLEVDRRAEVDVGTEYDTVTRAVTGECRGVSIRCVAEICLCRGDTAQASGEDQGTGGDSEETTNGDVNNSDF